MSFNFITLKALLSGFLLLVGVATTQAQTVTATAAKPPSDFPAGIGSVFDVTRNAFGHPLDGITNLERRTFFVGNDFFKNVWVQAPSSTTGRDGLGPTYNATSCSSCHGLDGRGVGYTKEGRVDQSLLIRLSAVNLQGFLGPHPVYGEQLNPFGLKDNPGEGKVSVRFDNIDVTYTDGTFVQLRLPVFSFSEINFGELAAGSRFSPRLAPQIIGLGLIEAIPLAAFEALADPQDQNNDGISGRMNMVLNRKTGQKQMGLFGWKAGQPTLEQQNASAFIGDMGLTTSLFPLQNCPAIQVDCANAPSGGDPEITDSQLKKTTVYTQLLAVPFRRQPRDPEVLLGETLFAQVSCQSCHQPEFRTGGDSEFEMLRNQIIFPYSDFLLHDMGPGLADHRPEELATGREWKTPPLWGVGLIRTVNGHQNLLHDGRAQNVEEAILWHGGEAEAAKQKFMSLEVRQRQALIKFVNSL